MFALKIWCNLFFLECVTMCARLCERHRNIHMHLVPCCCPRDNICHASEFNTGTVKKHRKSFWNRHKRELFTRLSISIIPLGYVFFFIIISVHQTAVEMWPKQRYKNAFEFRSFFWTHREGMILFVILLLAQFFISNRCVAKGSYVRCHFYCHLDSNLKLSLICA